MHLNVITQENQIKFNLSTKKLFTQTALLVVASWHFWYLLL